MTRDTTSNYLTEAEEMTRRYALDERRHHRVTQTHPTPAAAPAWPPACAASPTAWSSDPAYDRIATPRGQQPMKATRGVTSNNWAK